MESGAGSGSDGNSRSSAGTYKTGGNDTAKQLGFLLLAVAAFVGIQIWKRRSKKQQDESGEGTRKR
jgi:hypothetical protein